MLTLTGKILASGPRWKGHLPDDSFIVMITEIGGARMLCARRRKALVRAVRVSSEVGIVIGINYPHEPCFRFGDMPND